VNHDLRFLLAHHPAAYAVDRTAGANPIRQELENLDEAGSLYGAIIYQKAPIVMRHLERRVGEATFRDGLRTYLDRFRFGNATWHDLIVVLDPLVAEDLDAWSDVWVESAGRPTVATALALDAEGRIAFLEWRQSDPETLGRLWPQRLSPALVYADSIRRLTVDLRARAAATPGVQALPAPLFVLANGDGLPYGAFVPDSSSLAGLLGHLPAISDDMVRAAGWLTVWDVMLDRRLPPAAALDLAVRLLETERTDLTAQRVLVDIQELYWRFLLPEERVARAEDLEAFLWRELERAPTRSLKAAFFGAFRSVALTPPAVKRLERLWREQERIADLPLAERDFTALAQALALREAPRSTRILAEQRDRITNADRRARFEFVMPALSADTAERDGFFESLRDPANREPASSAPRGAGGALHPAESRAAGGDPADGGHLLPARLAERHARRPQHAECGGGGAGVPGRAARSPASAAGQVAPGGGWVVQERGDRVWTDDGQIALNRSSSSTTSDSAASSGSHVARSRSTTGRVASGVQISMHRASGSTVQ
jgi:aminopeptidase N